MLIDSHCHLDFAELAPVAPLLARCRAKGVGAIVVPGVSLEHLGRPLALARRYAEVYPAAGFHPWFLPGERAALATLQAFAHEHRHALVAIGEAGLDKYRGPALSEQQWWLEQQLALACELDKPVILHSVGTHDLLLNILKRFKGIQGVVHAFSGSVEQAQAFVRQGLYLGAGGVLTRTSAHKSRRAVAAVGPQHLLLETDAPSLLPAGLEAEHNSPEFLPEILASLAATLHLAPEVLGKTLSCNAKTLFAL